MRKMRIQLDSMANMRFLARGVHARLFPAQTRLRKPATARHATPDLQRKTRFSTSSDPVSQFSHVSPDGKAPQMVNVGDKRVTRRSATAKTTIRLPPAVLEELRRLTGRENAAGAQLVGPKGPIGTTAIIAGVLGAKQTSALIPFCHPLPIEDCQIKIDVAGCDCIEIECTVRVTHKTGVEMEALTGASVAALCVYDMCKALSHEIVIENTRLVKKTGGKSDYKAE